MTKLDQNQNWEFDLELGEVHISKSGIIMILAFLALTAQFN